MNEDREFERSRETMKKFAIARQTRGKRWAKEKRGKKKIERSKGGHVRKASNVRRPSVKPFFSENAASSRP